MLPSDYSKAVLADFHQKAAKHIIPLDMKQLSPGGIKEACLEVCREKFTKNDGQLLKSFFGDASDIQACLKAIDRLHPDKFRPVVNFLKEKTTKPDDKIVELVAWLIDFNPRPYDPRFKYGKLSGTNPGDSKGPSENTSTSDRPGTSEQKGAPDHKNSLDYNGPSDNEGPSEKIKIEMSPIEGYENTDGPPSPPVEVGEKGKKRKKIIFAITITVVLGMIIPLVWPNNSPAPTNIGHQACMYWNDDHFEPISCRPHGDTLVVPLDSNNVSHFRKINRPDTITTKSIGSVWYVRYRKDYEFYTAGGYHPLDPNLRLRPITEYIIRNHIHPKP